MRVLRAATEPEVIAAFLRAEFYQPEFDRDRSNFEQIVEHPDLANRIENRIRKTLLFRRRGHMWRELPDDTQWFEVELEAADMPNIRVFPRAQWRRFSRGTFRLDSVVDHVRSTPEGDNSDPVVAKIRLLHYRIQREQLTNPVLFIGVDEHSSWTILEGNHRIAAAYLLDPNRVHDMYRVLCGFSPRMTESCWYRTNVPNLFRYLRNRVRNIYDREADLGALARSLQDSYPKQSPPQKPGELPRSETKRMKSIASVLLLTLVVGTLPASAQTQTAPANSTDPTVSGMRVDPAAGPQTPAAQAPATQNQDSTSPVPPPAPQTSQDTQAQPAQVPEAPAPTRIPAPEQPVGAATAERGVTRGGVASRPAGVAIAPAKQRQSRSLLIKTGALLAGAVAVGTVYGLHKSTGSHPPGAGTAPTNTGH